MATPPLLSTYTAATEILITVVVVYFFRRAIAFRDYRFGIMTAALVYEAAFNITYMVSRLGGAEADEASTNPSWVPAFIGLHGGLSLLMFFGLVGLVYYAWRARREGELDPLGNHPGVSYGFLALWGVSIATGELIYAFYWMGVIQG